jgi:hypothetical protein
MVLPAWGQRMRLPYHALDQGAELRSPHWTRFRPDLGAGSFGPGMSPARGTWSRKRNRNLWLQHHNVEISTERLPGVAPSGNRRTPPARRCPAGVIALALGGEGGSRRSTLLGMPVSGDTLLRLIRAVPRSATENLCRFPRSTIRRSGDVRCRVIYVDGTGITGMGLDIFAALPHLRGSINNFSCFHAHPPPPRRRP